MYADSVCYGYTNTYIYTQDYSGMFKTCILFVCPAMLLAGIQSVDYSAYLKFQSGTSKQSKQDGKFLDMSGLRPG